MKLRPGLKLNSAVSGAQVIILRAPDGDVDLRCGSRPMVADGAPQAAEACVDGEQLLIGKRYNDSTGALEVLCTKPGAGELSVGGQPLVVKAARPLPASD
jgi:hypothetical protein